MKSIFSLLLLFSLSLNSWSQDFTGSWYGVLSAQGATYNLVLHIESDNGEYSTKLDSPDQGAYGIDMDETVVKDGVLTIKMAAMSLTITSELETVNGMKATYNQGPLSAPMTLSKKRALKLQDPKEPFSYTSKEVSFLNSEDGVTLAGTLTIPAGTGPFPGVILVSGSGPQDRNEEILGHRPFLVLADYLTNRGIAVLRYDDRGVGKSEGEFSGATSLEFANDAEAAFEFLSTQEGIHPDKVGVVGHSEGGLIAPMVAARNKEVDFIVMLAGPGVNGAEIILLQAELIGRADGVEEQMLAKNKALTRKAFDLVRENQDSSDLNERLTELLRKEMEKDMTAPEGMTIDRFVDAQVAQMTDPWFQFFLHYDPTQDIEKVDCPILALNGEKDLQVPSELNLNAIKKAAKKGGNKSVKTEELKGLNHLFQTADSGAPSEYADIEETFSEDALLLISDWIISTVE